MRSESIVYEIPVLGFNNDANIPFDDQMYLMIWVRVDQDTASMEAFEKACKSLGATLLSKEVLRHLPEGAEYGDADADFTAGHYEAAHQQLLARVGATYAQFDRGLSPAELQNKYAVLNGYEHPAFDQSDWRDEVSTTYWQWVRQKLDETTLMNTSENPEAPSIRHSGTHRVLLTTDDLSIEVFQYQESHPNPEWAGKWAFELMREDKCVEHRGGFNTSPEAISIAFKQMNVHSKSGPEEARDEGMSP